MDACLKIPATRRIADEGTDMIKFDYGHCLIESNSSKLSE